MKTANTFVEVNGPASISMLLDAFLEEGRINKEDYDVLKALASNTIEYLKLLSNPNGAVWYNVVNKSKV